MSILPPLLILVPVLGMAATALANKEHSYRIALISSGITLLLSAALVASISLSHAYPSFSVQYIMQLGVNFELAVSPLSLILVAMTAVVFFAAALVGEYFIGKSEKLYNVILLIGEAASLGVFLAANLLLLYIFWEIAEVVMFFIIFIYGGYNRRYAAIKFILYSLMSSLLLLIAIIILYANSSPHTFNILALSQATALMPGSIQLMVAALLIVSFMIKMPVFPLHSWLPVAHTEAPTTGSMILAGVLLKFGGYGLYLAFLLLPAMHAYSLDLAALFMFSSLYSAFVSLRQGNMKRMIAYTSITDMGIVALALAASTALTNTGAFYGMLSHGIAISLLFLMAGTVDELYGTLEIDKVHGIIRNFTRLPYIFILGVFAAIGLPLTSGFIADILIFLGAYKTFGLLALIPLASILIIGAALFWLAERSFMNSARSTEPLKPLDRIVTICSIFLLAATFLFGILPSLLI